MKAIFKTLVAVVKYANIAIWLINVLKYGVDTFPKEFKELETPKTESTNETVV